MTVTGPMIRQVMKVSVKKYNAFFAITGAIKGTSRLKLYSETGLESLMFI